MAQNDTLGALSWGSGADSGLSDEGRQRLFLLDQVLRARGVKGGTITSGRRRPDGTKSHHHEGNAIDIVAGGDMAKLAADLQSLGFRAQFERKGQRNPNGSVASGDHIHVTLIGGNPQPTKPKGFAAALETPATPKPRGFAAAFETEEKPQARGFAAAFEPETASTAGRGFASAFETAAPVAPPRRDSSPAAPPRPSGRRGGGKAVVADLMGELLAQPPPKATTGTAFNPLAVDDEAVAAAAAAARSKGTAPRTAPAREYSWLEKMGSLSNSYAAWLNQLAKEGKRIPNVTQDPAGHFAALPDALKRAFGEARAHFGPEAVQPEHFRTMIGAEKGKTPRALYNTAAVLDYVSSLATDPTGLVMTPVGKLAGKALGAGGRVVAKAGAPVGKLAGAQAGKLATAIKAEEKAVAAAQRLPALTTRATTLTGAPAARAQKAVLKAEQTIAARPTGAMGAAARQGLAVKQSVAIVAPTARLLTGALRAALLRRPSSAFTNSVGPIVQAGDELARHGIPVAKLAPNLKRAIAEVGAYRKSGQASADVAELLQHAPKVLDAPATLAGMETKTGGIIRKVWDAPFTMMSAADSLGKVALYKTLRASGMDAPEAARRVSDAMFNYEGLNKTLRAADQHGLFLFGSFLASSTKSFAQQLATRPDLVNRYGRFQEQMFAEFPGSREAFDKLPAYKRTPFTYPIGGDRFLDLQRFHQWTAQIGLLQDVLRHGAPAAQPPTLEAVVGKTAFGPLMSAVATEKRSVKQPEELSPGYWQFVKRVFPLAGDAERIKAAWEEMPLSDRRSDQAQTLLQAVAQAGLGASVVRAETKEAQAKRTSGATTARAKAATDLSRKLETGLRSGTVTIPESYRREAARLLNVDEAHQAYRDAKKVFDTKALSPRGVPSGELKDAYLRMTAMRQRLEALARGR